jgi:hypothetical protein
MRDGDASITLENAADPGKAPVDASSWYFAKFGSDAQSFQSVMNAAHDARSAAFLAAGVNDD